MTRALTAVRIDFQQRTRGAPRALGRLLAVLGAALALAVVLEYVSLGDEMAGQKAKMEEARRSGGGGPGGMSGTTADGQRGADSLRAASRVLDQLAMPWGALFTQIEGAGDEHVALISLQADPGNRNIRLGGEARDFSSLMTYVRRLEETAALADVHLAGHEVRAQDPRHPVAFTIVARWTQP